MRTAGGTEYMRLEISDNYFFPSQKKKELLKLWQIFARDLRFLTEFIMTVWEETEAELRWWSLTAAPVNSSWDSFEHASEEFVFDVSLSEYTGLKFLQPIVCFLSHPEVWLGLASLLEFLALTVKHSTRSHWEWDFLGVIHVILSFISSRVFYFLNTLLIPCDSSLIPFFPPYFPSSLLALVLSAELLAFLCCSNSCSLRTFSWSWCKV